MIESNIAVIFDMDGVLIDTVTLHWDAYNSLLAELHGVRVETEDLGDLIGMSLSEQVPLLNKKFGIDIDADSFIEEANRRKEIAMSNLSPMEGVVTLLKALKAQNIPIGVGTSTSRITAAERLKNIGIFDYFDVVIGEEDVKYHKPDPEVYLLVADKLNTKPEQCLVFEDAPNGLVAAKRAGMKSVGITSSYTDENKLHEASKVVSSLSGIDVESIINILTKE